MSEGNLQCSECGCEGNEGCGASIVDKSNFCTLDVFLVCPCCNVLGKEENMKRWKPITKNAAQIAESAAEQASVADLTAGAPWLPNMPQGV